MFLRDSNEFRLNHLSKVFYFFIFLFSANTTFAALCTKYIPTKCTTEECITDFCQSFEQEFMRKIREEVASEQAEFEKLSDQEREQILRKQQEDIRRMVQEKTSKQEAESPITNEGKKNKLDSCAYLYEMYTKYVREDCGRYSSFNDVCSASCGKSLGQEVYSNFRNIAKQSCKTRQLMRPESFKKQICLLESESSNSNLENPTAKRFASCAAKAVILTRLSEMGSRLDDDNKKKRFLSAHELVKFRHIYLKYRQATIRLIGNEDGLRTLGTAERLEAIAAYDPSETGNHNAYIKSTRQSLSDCDSFYNTKKKW